MAAGFAFGTSGPEPAGSGTVIEGEVGVCVLNSLGSGSRKMSLRAYGIGREIRR